MPLEKMSQELNSQQENGVGLIQRIRKTNERERE